MGLAPTTIGVRSVVMVSVRDARRILRTSWIVVLLTGCLFPLILTPVTEADVVGGCDDAFRAWLASCAEQEGIALSEDHCADGVAVVAASSDGQVLRIELSLDRRSTLARVGGIGLAPIGDFADWQTAPEPFHRSFEAVRACVAARAPVIIPSTQAVEAVACGVRCFLAWGAIGGFVVFMIASAQRRSRWLETGYAFSAVALAGVVRRLAIQPAFFHQNGHGAGWVLMAQCRPSTYGPGYAALFHPAALWGGAHAERAVFGAQEVLATAAIGAIYALARNLGNPRPVAWACTVAIGLEPLLGRLARSESYYATSLWLIGMAIAALFATGPRARGRDKRNWGGAALAGLLLATAVTVHPVAWVPAAFAPAVLVLHTGRRRERIISSLGAIGLIGAVGAAVALPSVRAVLHGQLGAQWGQTSPQGARLVWVGTLLAAPWIALLALPRRLAPWILPVSLVVGAVTLDRMTNLFGVDSHIAPARAWRLLFGPTVLAAFLAWLARLGHLAKQRSRHAPALLAVVVGVVGVTHAVTSFREATLLPTDALEMAVFAPWLQSLPATGRLFHLGRSGEMMQELPVYSRCGFSGPEVFALDAKEPPRTMLPGDYWFHSATCSSNLGRRWCDAMEHDAVLRPLHVERLPARPSLPYLPYDGSEVVSALYHVEAIRQPQ